MSRVEFDELLRQRIDSEQLNADPAPGWERMAAMLPPTAAVVPLVKKRRVLPYVAAAAASVAIIIMAAWMFSRDADTNIDRDHTLSEKPKTNLPATPDIKTVDSVEREEGQKGSRPVNSIFTSPGMNQAPTGEPSIVQDAQQVNGNTFDKKVEDLVIEHKVLPQNNEVKQHIARDEPVFNSPKEEAYKDNYTFKTPELTAARDRKYSDDLTSIGLGGGVNYGTMNTGYTLGLSARRYVSDKVFVDGTVAVLMNKNSESTLNYTGNFMADNAMANSENARARPSNENYYYPAQGLYYIQFNPSIGYKVGKKVAMSVGGDFQQMLQNSGNNETVMFSEGTDAKLFPTFDVGVTGKTEVNLTPSIQAGLMYREGLNNVIRNQSHYVNRRYLQVQVKYSLPIR